jgi:hypothetical protein
VKIEAKFDDLEAPQEFGPQFLTYVLWAITPDGRANNLGEVVTDSDNDAKLTATTHFQSFGLIVTAEPYFSVTMPSDLVVLENTVRPDTRGTVEQVRAKYQLLPRGEYTLTLGSTQHVAAGPKVSQDEYKALLALYEAQNAVQIARAAGAGAYAPDVFQKAEQLYHEAQSYNARKEDWKKVVTTAREASERAEDARLIAIKKKSDQEAVLTTRPVE